LWLVLCATNDLAALWAARELGARGLQPLEIVTGEVLAYNQRFAHRLTAGQPDVQIKLSDGRVINSATVRGTLNRLQSVPSAHLDRASATDRQYAEQELFALHLSWLHRLPGMMLNRPTPQGLSGAWRHPSEWVWLAAQAGLLTMPYQQSDWRKAPGAAVQARNSARTIIVVKDICCGPTAPPSVAAGCLRLAQLSATSLLGIDFHLASSGDWVFTNATPMPDLRLGGSALADALARALQS
jgi:hypothetical protein